MDWLVALVKDNHFIALIVPTLLGLVNFFVNIVIALSDGVLDTQEMHQLLSSASGAQLIMLLIVLLAMKRKKPK